MILKQAIPRYVLARVFKGNHVVTGYVDVLMPVLQQHPYSWQCSQLWLYSHTRDNAHTCDCIIILVTVLTPMTVPIPVTSMLMSVTVLIPVTCSCLYSRLWQCSHQWLLVLYTTLSPDWYGTEWLVGVIYHQRAWEKREKALKRLVASHLRSLPPHCLCSVNHPCRLTKLDERLPHPLPSPPTPTPSQAPECLSVRSFFS